MKEQSPLLSVITPVYNRRSTLANAMWSVLMQDFADYEYIVVDDGSTDGSWSEIERLAAVDSRIVGIRLAENSGVSAAYAVGLENARGKYIAILDSDDIAAKGRLLRQVDILEADSEIALVSGVAEWIDADGEVIGYFPGILHSGTGFPDEKEQLFLMQYYWGPKIVNSSCMFRRSLLERWPMPYGSRRDMSTDWEFFLHVSKGYKVVGLSEVLVRMNRDSNRVSLTKDKEAAFEVAHKSLRSIYLTYRYDNVNPVRLSVYRRAVSNQYVLESRYYYPSARSFARLFSSMVADPFNMYLYKTIYELSVRGVRALIRRLSRLFAKSHAL